MKKNELYMMMGLGAAIALFAMRPKKAAAATRPTGAQVIPVDPSAANGWQYFTDGTAIGPDGSYYYQGNWVYRP